MKRLFGHLKDNNETYVSHFLFAAKVGVTLTFRGLIFILHAIFPICNIPERWNIERTLIDACRWHNHTEGRKQK